jgi:soluble lytic murein transglycosylase-like protein
MTSGLESGVDFSLDGEAALELPDTVSVLPNSFAGSEPSGGSYEVASLPHAEAINSLAQDEIASPAQDEIAALPQAEPGETAPVTEIAYARPDTPRGEIDRLIAKYAAAYEVPEDLVRRVVRRESNFFSGAYNRGHWGLMQIKHATARGMGYDGPASGLLDAETNLKYAVKYLRGALLVADGNEEQADRLYQRGYYYDAKRKGLLDETGLGRDRVRRRI